MQVERLFQIDTAEAVLAGRVSPAIFVPSFSVPRAYTVPLRPAYTLDELFMFESTSRLVDAAGMADWPAAAAYVPLPREADIWEWVSSGPQYVDRALHMVSSRLLPSFGSVMRDSFRTLANRRMAAVALAIRLYEVDHGARPDRLDDLVPEYLPAVPRDPFAADGRALGYLPGAAPPVLYSVNVDGVDDGGCFELTAYGAIERDRADMPYFLNGDRPRAMIASPATQPASAPAGAARQSASKPASPAHSSASTQPVPASMQAVPDDHEIENAQGDESR